MKSITLYPGAKINIGLYVFEKRADGFHELESIFYPVGPENSNLEPDILTVTIFRSQEEYHSFISPDGDLEVGLTGNGKCNEEQKVLMLETGLEYPGNPDDNICVKAYNLLDADYDLPPAVISLEKHLPTGAGLGGGSSDGVSTLKALDHLCGLGLSEAKLMGYAEQLGSDCPFFVANQPMLVTGRGEILKPLQLPADLKNLSRNYTMHIVFSPECFVSTRKAYSIVPKRKRPTVSAAGNNSYIPLEKLVAQPVETWQGQIVNDFEAPVFKEYPQLEKVKASLLEEGAVYVSMTGSGSAIFALFAK